MSVPSICAALEKKLALMAAMPTAFENVTFTPTPGTPYQRVNHLINAPIDHTLAADLTELRGLMQVTLCYPLGAGRGAAQTRAQAVADHFAPVQYLTEGAVRVDLIHTPRIASGLVDGDRYCIPVTVAWSALT